MKFYLKFVWDSIRKNKRLYLPYILTCIGMVMMYYIIVFLENNEVLSEMVGGATIGIMLGLGGWVIAVFACIFLFYTNSFLIRRRKKEFGLYHILGMGKSNIAKMLFWETLLIAILSIGIGGAVGIALSKIAELGLVNIMKGEISYTLKVSFEGIRKTVMVFGIIFLLIFLNSLRQIQFSNAISLFRSENVGEKPPKGNWFFGLVGVVLLGAAYYIAVTIKDPITALALFFVAVLMVILGTYLLMIAGSVLFCRILQKKKGYYYKANHFVSISSMVYRMKRNGAGLASICILATMVLVMLSSTTCLYFGEEDAINSRYPRDINLSFTMENMERFSDENIGELREVILDMAEESGAAQENVYDFRTIYVTGLLENGVVETDVTKVNQFNLETYANVYQFYFISLSDYNRIMETEETLENGEAMIHVFRGNYQGETLSFENGATFTIKKRLDDLFDYNGSDMGNIIPGMAVIVPDLNESIQGLDKLADYNGDQMLTLRWVYDFDTGLDVEQQIALNNAYKEQFRKQEIWDRYGYLYFYSESQEFERQDFYGLFGGLFYMGILLSAVFVCAAVLIIYYKQISEGYEDQARFAVMRKVGMTRQEIRKSINSQLLTVFFMPLILAACHLAFAFPIVRKLLMLFNLFDVKLFAETTIISYLLFALFYTLVYRITSNAYYQIVSGVKDTD